METTTHNNKLSSVMQKIDIMYCFVPVAKISRRGTCCRVLRSILLSILQIIIATNRRMRIPHPRGDGGLSLFVFRQILYQKGMLRRKWKVGLKSPPRLNSQILCKMNPFSTKKKAVEDALCCLFSERRCLC